MASPHLRHAAISARRADRRFVRLIRSCWNPAGCRASRSSAETISADQRTRLMRRPHRQSVFQDCSHSPPWTLDSPDPYPRRPHSRGESGGARWRIQRSGEGPLGGGGAEPGGAVRDQAARRGARGSPRFRQTRLPQYLAGRDRRGARRQQAGALSLRPHQARDPLRGEEPGLRAGGSRSRRGVCSARPIRSSSCAPMSSAISSL
jgi:hypothetical protein